MIIYNNLKIQVKIELKIPLYTELTCGGQTPWSN